MHRMETPVIGVMCWGIAFHCRVGAALYVRFLTIGGRVLSKQEHRLHHPSRNVDFDGQWAWCYVFRGEQHLIILQLDSVMPHGQVVVTVDRMLSTHIGCGHGPGEGLIPPPLVAVLDHITDCAPERWWRGPPGCPPRCGAPPCAVTEPWRKWRLRVAIFLGRNFAGEVYLFRR
jgi:hypothetical protein